MIAMPKDARPVAGVKESVNVFAADCGTLLELQGRLFQVELAEWAGGVRRPATAFVAGVVLSAASLPLLLGSLVAYLYLNGHLTLPAALASVGTAAFVAALSLCALARRRIRATKASFPRSRHELRRNLEWLTSAVTSSVSRDRSRT